MLHRALLTLAFLAFPLPLMGDELISDLDVQRFDPPKEKATVALVGGKAGKAIEFTFEKEARSAFCTSNLRGQPEWDKAAGFSFWVKGDGSKSCGGLQFIYDDDYSVRYDYIFPIQSTEWTKITVAWEDLVPVLPGDKSVPLGKHGNSPSKLSALWVGRWWYWGDYPAHRFAIDELRLETRIDRLEFPSPRPNTHPLARVRKKLTAGEPVTIVTMGDSLTDTRHWANRTVNWPKLLQEGLEAKSHSKITVINPAIGGTQLRQGLALLPRWLQDAPEPDLVTICYGYNDWDAGMRKAQFEQTYIDAVRRIREATKGRAEVLIITSNPALKRWKTMTELATACRNAAKKTGVGVADTEQAFHEAGMQNPERLYVDDKVHISATGHALVAEALIDQLAEERD